jgi:predicted  nucleic acid-binding Zn-ribbon protein
MNPTLEILFSIQEIDSRIALLNRAYNAMDKGTAETAALETAQALYSRLKNETKSTHTDLQDSELELKRIEQKKKDFEQKLYGGRITVPKEMTAMEQEIESLGRMREKLDEKILTLMDQLELRKKEESAAKAKLSQAKKDFETQQTEYKNTVSKMTEEVKKLKEEREKLVPEIPAELFHQYESLRQAKGGIGLARIVQGSCSACRMTLSAAQIRKTKASATPQICDNCGRLLCI